MTTVLRSLGLVDSSDSVLVTGYGVVAASRITGVSITAASSTITGPAGSFTSAMNGQLFRLEKAGPVLVTGGTAVDGEDATWEASPLVGTFTYVSSTTGTLSAPAATTVASGTVIIGPDCSTALTAAIAAGKYLIPENTYLICKNVPIPSSKSLIGKSKWTSAVVSAEVGTTPLVSYYTTGPRVSNLRILGNGWGAQPTNVTPTANSVSDFIAKLEGSGCGVAFGYVEAGEITDCVVEHCGGDQVTSLRNGISGIYLTMGCRFSKVLRNFAQYNRIGLCEDNYFGISDDATLGAPKHNWFHGNRAIRNRIGIASDAGGNTRGLRLTENISNWNIVYGIEINRGRSGSGDNNTTDYNGRQPTTSAGTEPAASGLIIHGTSISVTCEEWRFTNHRSYANGGMGGRIDTYAKNCSIGGRFTWNGTHNVYFANHAENPILLPGSFLKNPGQNTSQSTNRDNIRLSDVDGVAQIMAGCQILDTQGTATAPYGIKETGTTDGTIVDDTVVISGFLTAPALLIGTTSRIGSANKRRKILLAAEGLRGENFDFMQAQGIVAMASGDVRGALVPLMGGETITNVYVHNTVVGATLTKTRIGIYSADGTSLLASTGDISAAFTAALAVAGQGEDRGGALGSAWTVPADALYYFTFLSIGTTPPTLLRSVSGVTNFAAKKTAVKRSINHTGQTDLPATLTLNASGTEIYFAWS